MKFARLNSPSSAIQGRSPHVVLLASRILLSALFAWSSIQKIAHPIGTQEYMEAHGMSLTLLGLIAAIAIELLGSLSLILGVKARWGAIALIGFTAIATVIFHRDFSDPIQPIMAYKNLAIIGGLLTIAQFGPGRLSLARSA